MFDIDKKYFFAVLFFILFLFPLLVISSGTSSSSNYNLTTDQGSAGSASSNNYNATFSETPVAGSASSSNYNFTVGLFTANAPPGATTTTASSSGDSGSGGGSGGGGYTFATISNNTSTANISYIPAGGKFVINYPNNLLSITKIEGYMNRPVYGMQIILSRISEFPTGIDKIEGSLYILLEAEKKNFTDKDIYSSDIHFDVSKNWLEENSLNSSEIILNVWNGTAWEMKEPVLLDVSEFYYSYSSDISAIDFFAVTGKNVTYIHTEETTTTTLHEKEKPEIISENFLILSIILFLLTVEGIWYYMQRYHSLYHIRKPFKP